MASILRQRRDTAANWSTNNPVIPDGQLVFDETNDTFRIGDGTTAYSSLTVQSGEQGNTGATGSQGVQGDTGATGNTGATGAQGDAGDVSTSVANIFTADQKFNAITETVETPSGSTLTPVLESDGTIFDVSGTLTITMPTAETGKSFTIVDSGSGTVSWGTSPAIKWAGGTTPTGGSNSISLYTFVCVGSTWYGMQAGTGFAV